MRRVILKLHLMVAIAAGLFIVILGVTGSIMAFEPELDHILHWKWAYVRPRGTPLTLAQISDAVRKTSPNHQIRGYALSSQPDLSYQVMMERQLVFVDQYSGEVLGEGTGGTDFLGFVHQLHLRLALLDGGRRFGEMTVRWSAVAALFLLISGAYLWWPTKRLGISGRPQSGRFWFDVHNSFGIVSLVFCLLLAVTGLVISFERQTTPLLYRMSHSQPPLFPRLQATPTPSQTPITPDQALAIARAAVPGAAPIFINVPHGNQVYQVSCRYPEDRTPGGRTRIAIDPYNRKILALIDSRHGPAGFRLVNLNRALHTGDVLGIPSKTLVSITSLLMPFQLLTGVVIWIRRRRAQARAEARGVAAVG